LRTTDRLETRLAKDERDDAQGTGSEGEDETRNGAAGLHAAEESETQMIEHIAAFLVTLIEAHQTAIVSALLTLAVLAVNDLINSARNYPKVETLLHVISDLLAMHQNADSPGTLKMPFTRSVDPAAISKLGAPVETK
jgi:hypothetical protein